MTFFDDLKLRPLDLNFGPAQLAASDTHPDKLDLSLGLYRSEEGEPMMFDVVREVRAMKATDPSQLEEYLSLLGNQEFSDVSRDLLFKDKNTDPEEYKKLCNRICSLHSSSATNGIYLGLLLLKHNVTDIKRTHTSRPCWVGYPTIVDNVGLEYNEHAYINKDSELDLEGILNYYESLNKKDVLLIQVSGHNPCGVDPTKEEWNKIAAVIKRKELIPLLDIAYQGFASGDIEEDSYPIRLFASMNIDFLVSHSFSKMMTIYSGRVGCLHVVMSREDQHVRDKIFSNLKHLARGIHGTPVRIYSEIACLIAKTPEYREKWLSELYQAYKRVRTAREQLYNKLVEYKVPGKWDHVINQKGMFCYLNIPEEKVIKLRDKHHIYLILNSRLCIAQLNENRADRVARAIKDVMETP